MKKTLVALAALATVGAAFAQSSVTLYGRIDATIRGQSQSTGGVDTAGNNPGFEVNSGGLTGSRFGLKGSEDLGGGMSAIFQLEGGIDVTTGASIQGGLLFGRQAYAGISASWGTITAGRQYSPLDSAWGNFDAQGYTTNSAMGYAWNGGFGNLTAMGLTGAGPQRGVSNDTGRINNSIMYASPNWSGFSGSIMYAPGENANKVTGQGNGEYWSFGLNYATGPFQIGLGYEDLKTTSAFVPASAGTAFSLSLPAGSTACGGALAAACTITGTTGNIAAALPSVDVSVDNWMIGASYDFGMATAYGGYQQGDRNRAGGGGSDDGWMIGVKVPIQKATFNIGYAYEKTKLDDAAGNNLASNGKNEAWGAQVTYPLSKRTSVYADFLVGKTRLAGAVSMPTTKNEIYGIGFRHDF